MVLTLLFFQSPYFAFLVLSRGQWAGRATLMQVLLQVLSQGVLVWLHQLCQLFSLSQHKVSWPLSNCKNINPSWHFYVLFLAEPSLLHLTLPMSQIHLVISCSSLCQRRRRRRMEPEASTLTVVKAAAWLLWKDMVQKLSHLQALVLWQNLRTSVAQHLISCFQNNAD